MIFRIRIGRWRFTFSAAPVVDVVGVNSKLKDGTHILMWDWDNITLGRVIAGLNITQLIYDLPNIYVLETKPPRQGLWHKDPDTGKEEWFIKPQKGNYMAYCFAKVTWAKAKEIIAATPNVCENFYKWGVFRRKFTLRISPKEGRCPKLVHILTSPRPEECTPDDLDDFVQYETLPRGMQGVFINLGSGNRQARRI